MPIKLKPIKPFKVTNNDTTFHNQNTIRLTKKLFLKPLESRKTDAELKKIDKDMSLLRNLSRKVYKKPEIRRGNSKLPDIVTNSSNLIPEPSFLVNPPANFLFESESDSQSETCSLTSQVNLSCEPPKLKTPTNNIKSKPLLLQMEYLKEKFKQTRIDNANDRLMSFRYDTKLSGDIVKLLVQKPVVIYMQQKIPRGSLMFFND